MSTEPLPHCAVYPMTSTVDARSRFSLHRQPFVYLAAAMIAGIIAGSYLHAVTPLVVLGGIALVVAGALMLSGRHQLTTLTLIAGFVISGALLSVVDQTRIEPNRLRVLYETGELNPDDPVRLRGVLGRPPEPAPGAGFLDLQCDAMTVGGRQTSVTGAVRLAVNLPDRTARAELDALDLGYGSVVSVLVRLERAGGFKNPGSPDFDEMLSIKRYDLRGNIKSPLLIDKVGSGIANFPLEWLYRVRLSAIREIDKQFAEPVAGTLKAMLFGNRYYMDPPTADNLRAGATFHVLSISGMHVGIIAWVLIGGWNTLRKRRLIRVGLALAALWAYAVMVGLEPPVLRATLMITVGLIGPMMFRRSASLNTVALAAFVMLVQNPSLINDPGFQLSFVAVAAIVAIAVPAAERLRSIGEWQPTPRTPHPPVCSKLVRSFAECLYWDQRSFNREMRYSAVRYGLRKSRFAAALSRWRLQWSLRTLALLLITSLAIQIATLPLMVIYFNRVSPVGILLNITSGVLTAVLMFGGVAAITLGGTLPGLGQTLVKIVTLAHAGLAESVVPFRHLPGTSFRLPNLYGWNAIAYFIYFVALVLLVAAIDRWRPVDRVVPIRETEPGRRPAKLSPKRIAASAVGCAVAAVLIAVFVPPSGRPQSGWLTLSFLDVGQGDSALAWFPNGTTMLIDGGGELSYNAPEPGYEQSGDESPNGNQQRLFRIGDSVVSRFLWSRGLTRIDYVLATHAHEDHIGGLRDVVTNFAIGQLVIGVKPEGDPEFKRFADLVISLGVPARSVKTGDRFFIDDVEVEVLWPDAAIQRFGRSGNNESVVLRLTYGAVAILLAGDIEAPAEARLINSGVDLRADVLKVAHHGSKTSSTEPFLERVRPRVAVISVGEHSPFGHPDVEVVARLTQPGTQVFQTGRSGTTTVETDGKSVRVSTYQNGER
ncbi:MAG TPA: ComEC/Rec2 family competence protein [Blastocatellia bacterium]|nr:ComEC/Rec2 family competence protein [Blastocatellia bacterium]